MKPIMFHTSKSINIKPIREFNIAALYGSDISISMINRNALSIIISMNMFLCDLKAIVTKFISREG